MANKMLIDATHPEETRVVVLRGNRVEEFDFESANRKQLRGNIYLAKVTRVEPSLQAAFVDYGGNRHGFLAFSEIHPDYYQIPIADRQALIDEEGRAQRAAEDEADRRSRRHRGHGRKVAAARHDEEMVRGEAAQTIAAGEAVGTKEAAESSEHGEHAAVEASTEATVEDSEVPATIAEGTLEELGSAEVTETLSETRGHDSTAGNAETPSSEAGGEYQGDDIAAAGYGDEGALPAEADALAVEVPHDTNAAAETGEGIAAKGEGAEKSEDQPENGEEDEAEDIVESVGGADALEEVPDRAPRYRRQYKIQEVIKRRQVMLVQVVKEERGSKGAALTTYLSLAGRYSVLMPNTARGGGISRKITSGEDRARLKEIAQELEVPEGMGVILRTAGANRTKTEIKRDFEYLLRLWETVRDLTLKSTAPKLVYEEGSLVKRSIRDLYTKDIDEVTVAGADAYQEAKEFMRMLMPSHAKNVKPYYDHQPLFSRYGVESQLDGMFSPIVQLRSGGYLVLNQAEALVAIDVNSGRATREHHIEDTALKTNLEAADEIARQLRLRDLAGLIVIDFIDMDEKRNNRSVERRLKECLKQDRARIQVGRISHFGLLEMSRQRIRTSVLESSTEKCPHCGGSGHVRSVSSLALQVLRALEEQLIKGATHNLVARTRSDVALYVLNQKRAHLRALEERFAISITVSADATLAAPQAFAIERGEQVHTLEAARALAERSEVAATPLEEEDELEDIEAIEADEAERVVAPEAAAEPAAGNGRRRRRRSRRGRNGGEANVQAPRHEDVAEPAAELAAETSADLAPGDLAEETGETVVVNQEERSEAPHENDRRRRRRGRRGGRRNRPERGRAESGAPLTAHEQNGETQIPSTAEELTVPPETEPELRNAVADLDADPPDASSELRDAVTDLDAGPPEESSESRGRQPPAEQEPETAPLAVEVAETQPEAAPVAAERPEPPRRRSTVREPAQAAAGGALTPQTAPAQPSAPVPQPVITETENSSDISDGNEGDRPRRRGWWSRRIAGG
jgi:ribonuclease E